MGLLFAIKTEKEADGRWITEVMEIPGALVYAATSEDAVAKVQALAFAWWLKGLSTKNSPLVLFNLNRKAAALRF